MVEELIKTSHVGFSLIPLMHLHSHICINMCKCKYSSTVTLTYLNKHKKTHAVRPRNRDYLVFLEGEKGNVFP